MKYRAIAIANIRAHKNLKELWFVCGKTEQQWQERLQYLQKQVENCKSEPWP